MADRPAPILFALWAGLLATIGAAQGLALLPKANADDIYALTFVSDVISGMGPIRWTVAQHNGFFPDKIIVAFGYLLGFDGGANLVFFSATYYLLLFAAIVFFLRNMNLDLPGATLAGAVVIMFCGFYDPAHEAIARLFVTACIHNGVVPFVLFTFGLIVGFIYGDDRESFPWLALLLTTLVVFSDSIALVQILAPALVAISLVAAIQKSRRQAAAMMGLMLLIGTGGGLTLQSVASSFDSIQHVPLTFQAHRMLEAAVSYVNLIGDVAGAIGWPRLVASFGGALVGIVMSMRVLLNRQLNSATFGVLIATLGALAALCGPIITGAFSEVAFIRQQLPFFVLPIIILVWLAVVTLKRVRAVPASVTVGCGLIGLTFLLVWSFTGPSSALGRAEGVRFLPKFRAMVDALVPLQTDMVMATYWDAKPLYIASNRSLPVCQIAGDLKPYSWSANLGWCEDGFREWSSRRNRIAIAMRELAPDVIENTYGLPEREIEVAGRTFALYSWSSELEERVRGLLCDIRDKFPRPAFCHG